MVRARDGEFDAVVAMYHDQGHIALKLLGMHAAVNITLGLPIVRTSVAHGTAFDRAWQGTANVRRHGGGDRNGGPVGKEPEMSEPSQRRLDSILASQRIIRLDCSRHRFAIIPE